MPLVESGRQRPARRLMLHRKQSLGRLPRLEGLPRRSRLTKENETHPSSIGATRFAVSRGAHSKDYREGNERHSGATSGGGGGAMPPQTGRAGVLGHVDDAALQRIRRLGDNFSLRMQQNILPTSPCAKHRSCRGSFPPACPAAPACCFHRPVSVTQILEVPIVGQPSGNYAAYAASQ